MIILILLLLLVIGLGLTLWQMSVCVNRLEDVCHALVECSDSLNELTETIQEGSDNARH